MRLKSAFISEYKNLKNFTLSFDGASFIKFISDGQKTTFANDVVPTLDAAHFAVFSPLFDFIKSKCIDVPAITSGELVL